MARAQGQQPMQQPHRFGIPAPSQPSTFHDQQQAQSQISNFSNTGLQNPQLHQYRNGVFAPFNGNAQQLRQFQMAGLAQNQQSQNGSLNMPQRVAQQQAGSNVHPGQPPTFPSSDL